METRGTHVPVCGSRLPGDRHTYRNTLRTASSVKQIFPAGDPLPQLRRRVCWRGGASVHAKGSLSAGGPLPVLHVHTCDISHQHLSCPQPLQELVCDCVSLAGGVWKHRGSQKLTLRFPGLSDIGL